MASPHFLILPLCKTATIIQVLWVAIRLAVLAPIMMALTAATPIVKGRLAATDVRWSLISQSVDDRTPAERGEAPDAPPDSRMAGGGVSRQTKSRYDSISCSWAELWNPSCSR